MGRLEGGLSRGGAQQVGSSLLLPSIPQPFCAALKYHISSGCLTLKITLKKARSHVSCQVFLTLHCIFKEETHYMFSFVVYLDFFKRLD